MNTGTYDKLIVALDGDAKLCHSVIEGHYTLASTPVNGKQTWIHDQGSYAIWYEKNGNNWNIGTKDNLETSIYWLHSTYDTNGPEEDTRWKYWSKNDDWISTTIIFGPSSMY